MKKIISLTAAILIFNLVSSQQIDLDLYQNQSVEINQNARYINVKGNPYINEELEPGFLYKDSQNSSSIFIRYNVVEDQMEFNSINSKEGLKVLPKNSEYIINIGGENYQYLELSLNGKDQSGYYKIIKSIGENSLLLHRTEKFIKKAEGISASSYSISDGRDKIITSDFYVFLEDGKASKIKNHKKKSLDTFPDSYKNDLKSYIKDKKIKFDDSAKGLVGLIEEYLRLKKEKI